MGCKKSPKKEQAVPEGTACFLWDFFTAPCFIPQPYKLSG